MVADRNLNVSKSGSRYVDTRAKCRITVVIIALRRHELCVMPTLRVVCIIGMILELVHCNVMPSETHRSMNALHPAHQQNMMHAQEIAVEEQQAPHWIHPTVVSLAAKNCKVCGLASRKRNRCNGANRT